MARGFKLVAVLLNILLLSQLFAGCRAPARKPAAQEPIISLYVNQSGEVKRMKIEDYLPGVVAAEMDPTWPLNALAAQAILARTFTMKKIQEGGVKAHGTDASTSVEEFQAYDPTKINDNVRRAVEMTRGEVVKYNGNYINAWFYASGGSRTASSAIEGLNFRSEPAPYIQSVPDPGMAITTAENKSWTASFSNAELAAAVRKITGQDPGPITSVRVAARGPSGRATQLRIGRVTVDVPALRLALGNDRLRSTLITGITTSGGRVTFKGEGYGHGVGMSQWGARALAQQGKSPQDIIKYFFKDIQLVKAW